MNGADSRDVHKSAPVCLKQDPKFILRFRNSLTEPSWNLVFQIMSKRMRFFSFLFNLVLCYTVFYKSGPFLMIKVDFRYWFLPFIKWDISLKLDTVKYVLYSMFTWDHIIRMAQIKKTFLEKKLKISRGGERKDRVGIVDRLIRKIGNHAQKIWCVHDKQIPHITEWVAKTEEWKKSLDIRH